MKRETHTEREREREREIGELEIGSGRIRKISSVRGWLAALWILLF